MTTLELGREYPPRDEARSIAEVERSTRAILDRLYPEGACPVRRDAHPKAHGLVRAELRIDDDLPDAYRHGVFREAKKFQACVRFSNGSPDVTQSDTESDVRGMAIKLLDVPGEKVLDDERQAPTQDFVLMTAPVFFIRDAAEFAEFSRKVEEGKPKRYFLNWDRILERLKELRKLKSGMIDGFQSPLTIEYWSATPYRLGPHAVKYNLQPRPTNQKKLSVKEGPDYLRAALAEYLADSSAYFDFKIQLQTDAEKMPVEDATTLWEEKASRYYKVGSLKIPKQRFDNAACNELSENLSFTPWHALEEHRPLGGINRVRKVVYQTISRIRHERNGVERREPSLADLERVIPL